MKLERKIAIAKGEYYLSKIIDEDMKIYIELQRQVVGADTLYLNPHYRGVMWQSNLERQHLYGIFDNSMTFVGTVELMNELSRTPEIGIAILKEYRNRGIAQTAVEMLIELTYKPQSIDHYLVLIKSNNTHSKHVFEKMGAIYVGEELNIYEKINEYGKIRMEGGNVSDGLLDLFEAHENDSTIMTYKIFPKTGQSNLDEKI